jgi:hypothetical protein
MRPTLFLAALLCCVPAYADDLPDVFAVGPAVTADTLMLDVFTCGCEEHLPEHKAKLDAVLTLDVFSAGPVVASKPAEVPSPAVPVAPKPTPKQIAPQTIQYAAPTCRFVWTRFGWQQVCQ